MNPTMTLRQRWTLSALPDFIGREKDGLGPQVAGLAVTPELW
jgi:hypothetical protein